MKKVVWLLVLVSLITSGAEVFAQSKEKSVEDDIDTYEWLKLFGDVFELIKRDYVEEVSDKDLIESAIDGMLTARDPHSGYLDSKNFKAMGTQTSGSFGGIGITFTMDKGSPKIISAIDGTPAAKAGIKSGDIITHINGKAGLTSDEAAEVMRGRPGTKIKLSIYRESAQETYDVVLRREVIKVDSVRSEIKDGIGYLRISSFNNNTYDELVDNILKLQKKQKGIPGYVLDLRNNPGGILCQAASVADLFLTQGEIYSTRDRNKESRVNAVSGDILNGTPMVVLINEGSASASEIVAGALQDHKRAVVVGVRSFGKGSIQTVRPVSNQTGIRLTTARYYTPSGRSIQAEGIAPDIEIRPAKIEELAAFDRYSEANLSNALKNDNGQTLSKKDEALKFDPKDNKLPVGVLQKVRGGRIDDGKKEGKDDVKDEKLKDYQLIRGIEILKGIAISSEGDNLGKPKESTPFVRKTKKGSDGCVILDEKDKPV